jgi:hypothetical protein
MMIPITEKPRYSYHQGSQDNNSIKNNTYQRQFC